MEAVAIGTAKSALNSVVKTATTAITNEIGLLLGVQEELFFIKEELQMMRAFLRAAKTENMKGEIVTTWINQVEELAFDVEDCLQEASVHLMKKSCLPVMCSVKKRDHIARKIRVLKTRIEDVSKRNLRYNLINKENGSQTYDQSASTRSIAYVEALLVGLDEPKRKLVDLILKEDGEVISVVGMGGLGKTTLAREVYGCQKLRDEFKFFAWVTVLHPFNMEEFIESLVKQILSDAQENDNKGRIMEGNIKKPELSRKQSIKEKMEELIESLVKQIPPNPDDKKSEQSPKKTLKEKVTAYLNFKKYLIVLDDLSSQSEWDKIKDVLPRDNGRRIIVTTRNKSPLAESISHPSDNIYEIKELSEKDAFDLFCKAVYKTPNYRLVTDGGPSSTEITEEDSKVQNRCTTNTITEEDDKEIKVDLPQKNKCNMKNGSSSTEITKENTITEDMKTQADLIIKSCGRLPLAIVTIGSYLATKPKTSVEWKTMHEHLSSEFANNPDLGVVNNVLTSSYDGMPHHLKPSLLYLSVFHNHKEIRRSRIIRRWMADGYVMEGHKRTAEEVGKGYFNDLMGRSLIQPSQTSTIVNGDIKECNIHDMMYELILTKAVDESMVSLLEDGKLISMTDKMRHLVIPGGPRTGGKALKRVKLSHMRSVSIFGEVGDYLRYSRMKLVRVLDLEGTLDLHNRDLRSVGKLRHLKYLGLRGTKITKLPDSLGKLSELETLDIRNTMVVQLPTGIAKLQKLSYLRAGMVGYEFVHAGMFDIDNIDSMEKFTNCVFHLYSKKQIFLTLLLLGLMCCFPPLFCLISRMQHPVLYDNTHGVRAPRGIGELRSLNILGVIDIGGRKNLAKQMQNLTNLSKLAVTGFTKKNGKTLAEVIDGLKQLRSLVLSAKDNLGLRCCLQAVSSSPKYLQSLKLYSPLGELPDWISSLENLEKIYFKNTKLTGEIKAIEKLPNLKILYCLGSSFEDDVKELCFGEGTFPMLQVMILERIEKLESVSIEKTALKSLKQLKMRRCWDIREDGVSGLEFLEQLKEMEVVLVLSFLDLPWRSADDNAKDQQRNNTFVSNLQKKLSMHSTKPVLRVIKEEAVWIGRFSG